MGIRRDRRIDLLPYVLVAPVAVFTVTLAVAPAVTSVVQSFFIVNPLDPPVRFGGLRNLRAVATDPAVLSSLGNTAFYVVVGVVLSTVLGVAMALVLQKAFRGRSLLIAVLVLPWALPGVTSGILWTGIFDPGAGLIASTLRSLGLTSGDVVLLGQDQLLTVTLIELVQVWQITPLSALLVLASLQLVPDSLYEAASLDGAGALGRFWHITLPLVRPGVAVAVVQAIIATLNVFDQPYVLNGAASTGASVMMQTYFTSFDSLDFGQGYALSLLVTIATVVLSLLAVRLIHRKVDL